MKVIGLDCDGVINGTPTFIVNSMMYDEDGSNTDDVIHPIDRNMLLLVAKLCKEHNAKVFIMSTWRVGQSIDWFSEKFKSLGWDDPQIIGMTDELHDGISCTRRGREVEKFINEWNEKHLSTPDMCIDKYLLLDDDSDFLRTQPLLKTNGRNGFTFKDYVFADMLMSDRYTMDQVVEICINLRY